MSELAVAVAVALIDDLEQQAKQQWSTAQQRLDVYQSQIVQLQEQLQQLSREIPSDVVSSEIVERLYHDLYQSLQHMHHELQNALDEFRQQQQQRFEQHVEAAEQRYTTVTQHIKAVCERITALSSTVEQQHTLLAQTTSRLQGLDPLARCVTQLRTIVSDIQSFLRFLKTGKKGEYLASDGEGGLVFAVPPRGGGGSRGSSVDLSRIFAAFVLDFENPGHLVVDLDQASVVYDITKL